MTKRGWWGSRLESWWYYISISNGLEGIKKCLFKFMHELHTWKSVDWNGIFNFFRSCRSLLRDVKRISLWWHFTSADFHWTRASRRVCMTLTMFLHEPFVPHRFCQPFRHDDVQKEFPCKRRKAFLKIKFHVVVQQECKQAQAEMFVIPLCATKKCLSLLIHHQQHDNVMNYNIPSILAPFRNRTLRLL